MADDASTAQRDAFVSGAAARALDTPDKPQTPEAVERAWSALHSFFGRVERESVTVLVLWNFDVGSARLKYEHKKALKQFFSVTEFARGSNGEDTIRYRVMGYASATGAEKYNESISRRRAEEVATFLTSQFGVPSLLVTTTALGDHPQRGISVPAAEPGEWYARYRQVRLERIPTQLVVPPSPIEDPEVLGPGPVPPKPATDIPNQTLVPVSFEFSIPPQGTIDVGGWINVYATFSVQGKFSFVIQGADSAAGLKGVVSLNDLKRKVKVEAEKKMSDNIKLKLGADIGELSKKPGGGIGAKGLLSFKELGPFTNVELGINLSRLAAPLSVAKAWKEVYELSVDGQPITFEAQLQGTLNVGLGPKLQARLGQMATQALEGATVAEGATVGTVGGGTVAAGVTGGILVVVGTLFGIAMTLDAANNQGLDRAQVISLRHGFALTVAVGLLGHGPETDSYANSLDAEYARMGTQKAYLEGRADALAQLRGGNREGRVQLRDALRAQYGDEVQKLHHALFVALGGLERGDPAKPLRLADIPVRLP